MRAADRQRGVAAVEFALLASILLMIAFSATEFGRAFYYYNTLVKASRTAAREFSFGGPKGTVTSREDAAKCLAVYGKRPCNSKNDVPILEDLTLVLVDIGATTTETFSAGGVSYSYSFFCVTINGFPFRSVVWWILPDIKFGEIKTCMRQAV